MKKILNVFCCMFLLTMMVGVSIPSFARGGCCLFGLGDDDEQEDKEKPDSLFEDEDEEDEEEDDDENGNKSAKSSVTNRHPLDLVNVTANYLMSFEAYNMAKKSNKPEVRANTPKYLKAYRIATANLLKMLREDGLYNPIKSKNYAGKYNSSMRKNGCPGFDTTVNKSKLKEMRDKVKEAITAGKEPTEITKIVYEYCPSYDESATYQSDDPNAVNYSSYTIVDPITGLSKLIIFNSKNCNYGKSQEDSTDLNDNSIAAGQGVNSPSKLKEP